MGFMFNKLQRKIFFTTFLVITISVSLFLLWEHEKDKKNLYERLVIHMKENSFNIKRRIESARNLNEVQGILEDVSESLDEQEHSLNNHANPLLIPPHEIHVVDADGIITASTKDELRGNHIEDAIRHKEAGLQDVLQGITDYSIEQMDHQGVKVLDISVPIKVNNQIIGALHYVEPYLKLEQLFKESFLRHAFFALILIVSLSFFINLFLSKLVTTPIKTLSSAMDEIRLDGKSKDIAISTHDEIGLLADSFNKMSNALAQREREIKQYTTSLEQLVDERTKKLRESHAQLIQTEKLASMGKLAGYVAHEINNPIGVIVSRAECIFMDAKEKGYPDYLLRDIEVIKNHSNRIADIAKGMLTFARKSPAEFNDVDINGVIHETLSLLEKHLSNNNIALNKHMAKNLPKIYGNSNQLQQVFFNIFNNAIDAMPNRGEIKIQSELSNNNFVRILISDTGIGIMAKHKDKIFDPFFTTKQDGKGTGLGLSVTYGIIRDHHGQISVQSKEGAGTTFEILLPRNKEPWKEA
jgi:signal transduction histidine kinase